MTAQPQPEPDAFTRYDGAAPSDQLQTKRICDGCRELSARVDRLEQLLAAQADNHGDPLANSELGTASCDWICIGAHATVLFLLFANESLVQFGLMMSVASIATLMACEVLSTRPIHVQMGRSLFASSVFICAAVTGMWLADVAKPTELTPYLLMVFPPVYASGWIVAKLFAWARGWRIVPPGRSGASSPLQIRHLLICTFLIAAYLAATRLLIQNMTTWFVEDGVIIFLFLCSSAAACTIVSCLLASILLVRDRYRVAWRVTRLVVASIAGMMIVCMALLGLMNGMTFDFGMTLPLLFYVIPFAFGLFASSGGTFALMRRARYQFVSGDGATPVPTSS